MTLNKEKQRRRGKSERKKGIVAGTEGREEGRREERESF